MARKIADTKKMTREEWLSLRKSSIGGSESGALIGENPYSSAITVYADKLGLSKPIEDNEAMRLGRDLEQYVAERFMEATGKKVRNDYFMYADDEYDFLTANVDRRIVGENAGLECKTMSSFNGYNIAGGEIPRHYYAQCQHYMMVMGFDYMYIGVLVYQKGFYWHKIDRNDQYIADMREAEIDFWKNNVEAHNMPDPDGSDAAFDTIKELYPKPEKDSKIAIPGLDPLIKEYRQYAAAEKEYKELKTQTQAVICSKLGNNEVAVGSAYGCSWKLQSKPNINPKKLKEKYPAIYDELVDVSEFRVLRTKELK